MMSGMLDLSSNELFHLLERIVYLPVKEDLLQPVGVITNCDNLIQFFFGQLEAKVVQKPQ